jgi:hypothetical protein
VAENIKDLLQNPITRCVLAASVPVDELCPRSTGGLLDRPRTMLVSFAEPQRISCTCCTRLHMFDNQLACSSDQALNGTRCPALPLFLIWRTDQCVHSPTALLILRGFRFE